jgi:hypothetical protein
MHQARLYQTRNAAIDGQGREVTLFRRQAFYQLLNYKDDVDLEAKIDEW